ncbi:Uncharacterised protein [Mycobacteroides abscessus]|nr:Uncharacterised protein [Mycobacteroides abscessus]CPZ75687.1 Uncharacterised protein [Mycobacteroides abscessus]
MIMDQIEFLSSRKRLQKVALVNVGTNGITASESHHCCLNDALRDSSGITDNKQPSNIRLAAVVYGNQIPHEFHFRRYDYCGFV